MGGGGASLALVSGYVLAACLATADLEPGLAAYEEWMRPLVRDVQDIPRWIVPFAYPRTRLGVSARRVFDRVITSSVLAPLMARFTRIADTDRPLPPLPVARP